DFTPGYGERTRAALRQAISALEDRRKSETDPNVAEDLVILIDAAGRQIQGSELQEKLQVPYTNIARLIFTSVRALLDPQIAPERRPAALPRVRYEFQLRQVGVDISGEELAQKAHRGFDQIQGEMQRIAARVAQQRGLPNGNYRDVIRELKKSQIPDDKVLDFYKRRLAQIEEIIRSHHLVTLPARAARIRLGTPAENAQQPAPHMVPPRLIGNTGEQGEFVLPLSM